MRCCDFSRLTLAAFAGLPRSALALGFAALGRGRLGGLETNYHEGSSRLTDRCREQPTLAVQRLTTSSAQHAVDLTGSACRRSPGTFTMRFARVVLGEDQGILREGLRALIDRDPDAAMSGEADAVADGAGVLP